MKRSPWITTKIGMNLPRKIRSADQDDSSVRLLSRDLLFFFNAGLIFATTMAYLASAYIDIVTHF